MTVPDAHISDSLLCACADPFVNENSVARVLQLAQDYADWDTLIARADAHALTPLVYTHLKAANVQLPAMLANQLKLIYLQQRRIYQTRSTVLKEVLSAFQQANIGVLVLKGGALAQLLYADPVLRPMRDLDLLVAPDQALQAQALLKNLGFTAPIPKARELKLSHQLPEAFKHRDGIQVTIEIHVEVLSKDRPIRLDWHNLKQPLMDFSVQDVNAKTLSLEEMLFHLCHHLVTMGQSIRLIGIADIRGFIEHYHQLLDWPLIKRKYPFVLSTLYLIHLLTPLNDSVVEQYLGSRRKLPTDIGVEYQGWPYRSWNKPQCHPDSLKQLLMDSLNPPEWWLRLHYGLGIGGSALVGRYVMHPWHLLKLAMLWLLTLK